MKNIWEPMVTIDDFPVRWRHPDTYNYNVSQVHILKVKEKPIENFSFGNCLALFEDIFNKAEKNIFLSRDN